MKTPREILLSRHRGAGPALDAVRKDALKAITSRRTEKPAVKQGAASTLWAICRELFVPARRIWSGLAACWALIFVLHFAAHETPTVVAKTSAQPTPEMMAALRPQQQLFVELLSGETKQNDADEPRRSRPMPHSEIRRPFAIV
jgi:hypothetical protein